MTGNIIDTIDEALVDWSVSEDAMRWTPDSAKAVPTMPRPTFLSRGFTTVTTEVDTGPFVRAMTLVADMVEQLFITHGEAMRRLVSAMEPLRPPRPPHQPIALCIDGHEYRRRQRGRKGRR